MWRFGAWLVCGLMLAGCASAQGRAMHTEIPLALDRPTVVTPAADRATTWPVEATVSEGESYSCAVPILGERWQRAYEVAGKFYQPILNCTGFMQQGIASWYGDDFHGKLTSNGETFDMNAISAAHKTLPLGIWVKVTNLGNGKVLVLRVNDRGPYFKDRVLDLSKAAAKELGFYEVGTTPILVEALGYAPSEQIAAGGAGSAVSVSGAPFRAGEVIYGSSTKAGEFNPDQVRPRYAVQVAAFQTAEKAEAVFRTVQGRFQGAVLKPLMSGGNQFYSIRIEPFASRQEAEVVRQALAEIGFPGSMIVLDNFETV
jgi:rare lipoprotein A